MAEVEPRKTGVRHVIVCKLADVFIATISVSNDRRQIWMG